VGGVRVRHQRDAEVPQRILVPLEHALECVVRGGCLVSVDLGADLGLGHPPFGVRERDDEVEQPLGRVHALRHPVRLPAASAPASAVA